jgi:NADH-quinone oxidoreductase subunit C
MSALSPAVPAAKLVVHPDAHPLYDTVWAKLRERFGESVRLWPEPADVLTVVIEKPVWVEAVTFLYQEPELSFQFLTTLCGVHYPDMNPPSMALVLHLHSLTHHCRIRLKCVTADVKDPVFPTLTGLFSAANWMERETYDFFGFHFTGHPNLTRILNEDDLTFFPMRKEYPLEDPTREDKDDKMFGRSD